MAVLFFISEHRFVHISLSAEISWTGPLQLIPKEKKSLLGALHNYKTIKALAQCNELPLPPYVEGLPTTCVSPSHHNTCCHYIREIFLSRA